MLIIIYTRCTGLSIGSIMVRLGGIFMLYANIETYKYPWMFYSGVTILGRFLKAYETFEFFLYITLVYLMSRKTTIRN